MQLNGKTILAILVLFLLGTNLAVIFTYWHHRQSEIKATQSKIEIPDTQFGHFFRDELDLDDNQQNSFREFRRTYNRSANGVLAEMQQIRTEMAATLRTAYPDRKKLDKLATRLGEKHKELKELTFDYYFNLQSVLDEEQQGKMVEIFQAMLTETGEAKTPVPGHDRQGEGQGQGRGHGQGWRSLADTTDVLN